MIYTKWRNPIGCYALAKNCNWLRQITPLSNLARVSLLMEWKLTAMEELNCEIYWQILKKMLEKSSQFLSSDQPSEPKSLDIALNIAGVEKYARKTCDCGQPGGHSGFEFWTERNVSDGGNLFSLWSVLLKSVWNSVGDTFKLRCSWLWAVVSRTLLAADVPWNGADWNIRIGKQGCEFSELS